MPTTAPEKEIQPIATSRAPTGSEALGQPHRYTGGDPALDKRIRAGEFTAPFLKTPGESAARPTQGSLSPSELAVLRAKLGIVATASPPAAETDRLAAARRLLGFDGGAGGAGGPPSGDGGRGGRPRGPEGPRGPRGPRGPENLWSPEFMERGRWIAEEITRMETTLTYEVRHNEKNGHILDKHYKDLQNFVEIWKAIRNDRNPWDPFLRDPEGRVIGVKPKEGYVIPREVTPAQPENLTGLNIYDLGMRYVSEATPPDELPQIEENMQSCFKEARRLGLLEGVDSALRPLLDQIHGERGEVENGLALARNVAVATFRVHRADPNLGELGRIIPASEGVPARSMLMGVLNAYIDWAEERFLLARVDQNVKPHREGEFNFNPQETPRQGRKFWERIIGYPNMYRILARTREEFQIAKKTFRRFLKRNGLGDNPGEQLDAMRSFIRLFGERGQDEDVDREVQLGGFIADERRELEYGAYSGGASDAMEKYNPPGYIQFMMAIAQDTGPQRFVRGARSGEGKTGAFLWKFDYDPRLWLFHNPGGSRGQIANDTVTQNCLQSFIKEMLIEEGMGIVLKDYDPTYDGPESSVKTLDTPEMTRARAEIQKINLERIGLFQSHEDFMNLYEGFDPRDPGNAHVANYKRFGSLDRSQLPEKLRKSIELGRVQLEVRQIREQIREGSLVMSDGKSTILELLSGDDRAIYQEAYEEAEDAFGTAFEMVGILGEKARRGGGVFFVDRNKHVRAYRSREARGDEKLSLIQKVKNGWSESEILGSILLKLRTGATVGKLDTEERDFYQGLSKIVRDRNILGRTEYKLERVAPPAGRGDIIPVFNDKDRKDVIDHVPVAQGLGFVQYIVTWAQIAYSYLPPVERQKKVDEARKQALDDFEKNGLQAEHRVKKVLFDAEGNVTGVDESVIARTVGFQDALIHPYSNSTLNPYLFYQQNTRHLFTTEGVIAEAKQLRQDLEAGLPFDRRKALPATLLIADPALKFFRSLWGSAMHDEIVAAGAAIEVSYKNSRLVKKELYARFLPQDTNRNKIRVGYYGEDYGGFSRFVINFIPFIAAHSKRFNRRYIAELSLSPMDVPSMPAMNGQDGVLGQIGMFADPVGEIAGQRLAGQFLITKFIDLMKYGWMMFGHLVGHTDSEKGMNLEGWYEKPTNSSENLQALEGLRMLAIRMKLPNANANSIKRNKEGYFQDSKGALIHKDALDAEVKALHAFIEAFGRLDKVLKLMRVMYGDVMNKQGLVIPKENVFMEDGSFNPEINWETDTGTSRHMEQEVFDAFIDWLVDPTGGCAAYESEADLFQLLKEPSWINPKMTRAQWIFTKLGR